MERLPRYTKMFAPNFTCVVVLTMFSNRWSFKHPADFSSRVYFSLRMMKTSLCYQSPASKCQTQTNRIKTVIIGRKTLIQASFGSPAMLFKLIYSPARSAQITLMKFNLTREKHLSLLSRLTKSVNKTTSGMLSETMVVVKTRPLERSHKRQ